MKKIFVSDITLKVVEEQGCDLKFREKLFIAEKLDLSGVDAIELPVLTDSKENEVIYRTIATTVKNAQIKVPVSDENGFSLALDCINKTNNVCLQVVMPVSTAQMEYFYHLKSSAMQVKIEQMIKTAREMCDKVEFVAKDAFRAEEGFIDALAQIAEQSGACSITLCDDAGEAFPEDYVKLINKIKSVSKIDIFVQPSNAMSLASACALSAIGAGACGVKTSVVGKYLAMDVLSDIFRAKKYQMGVCCDIDATNVKSISSAINGVAEDLCEQEEKNQKIGFIDGNSSIKEVGEVIKQLGYELSDSDVGKVYEEFKKLASKKETIDNKELEAVIASTAMQVPSTYHLVNYVVNSSNIIPATANITLEKDGEKFTGVSTGDGPIDAAFHAIEQVIGHHYELDDFQVQAVTKGRGAVGSSIIRLRADGKLYPGNGVSTDIVGACIRAYINALNKIVYEEN